VERVWLGPALALELALLGGAVVGEQLEGRAPLHELHLPIQHHRRGHHDQVRAPDAPGKAGTAQQQRVAHLKNVFLLQHKQNNKKNAYTMARCSRSMKLLLHASHTQHAVAAPAPQTKGYPKKAHPRFPDPAALRFRLPCQDMRAGVCVCFFGGGARSRAWTHFSQARYASRAMVMMVLPSPCINGVNSHPMRWHG
jgi:hypothetical protein